MDLPKIRLTQPQVELELGGAWKFPPACILNFSFIELL